MKSNSPKTVIKTETNLLEPFGFIFMLLIICKIPASEGDLFIKLQNKGTGV